MWLGLLCYLFDTNRAPARLRVSASADADSVFLVEGKSGGQRDLLTHPVGLRRECDLSSGQPERACVRRLGD
jgi:hypothetical protein